MGQPGSPGRAAVARQVRSSPVDQTHDTLRPRTASGCFIWLASALAPLVAALARVYDAHSLSARGITWLASALAPLVAALARVYDAHSLSARGITWLASALAPLVA